MRGPGGNPAGPAAFLLGWRESCLKSKGKLLCSLFEAMTQKEFRDIRQGKLNGEKGGKWSNIDKSTIHFFSSYWKMNYAGKKKY